MVFTPSVSDFVSFYDIGSDPRTNRQCIFLTLEGARCRHQCSSVKQITSAELLRRISTASSSAVDLELLQGLVLSKCCTQGRHQSKIEGLRLLQPLAQRWQDEIQMHRVPHSVVSSAISNAVEATGHNDRRDGSFNDAIRLNNRDRRSSGRGLHRLVSQNHTRTGNIFDSQARYNLRSYGAPAILVYTPDDGDLHSSLSEFRPYKTGPGSQDPVYNKINTALKGKDWKFGSVYIFGKPSAPNHVKIGWTSRSVSCRLREWSTCGYSPSPLYDTDRVPHAQRVEKLAHLELIDERRRELNCRCHREHEEWFEVSEERAQEVVDEWADFMEIAEPYDYRSGELKPEWEDIVEAMHGRGELITAKSLLQYCESSAEHHQETDSTHHTSMASETRGQVSSVPTPNRLQDSIRRAPAGHETRANHAAETTTRTDFLHSTPPYEDILDMIYQLCRDFEVLLDRVALDRIGAPQTVHVESTPLLQLSVRA